MLLILLASFLTNYKKDSLVMVDPRRSIKLDLYSHTHILIASDNRDYSAILASAHFRTPHTHVS